MNDFTSTRRQLVTGALATAGAMLAVPALSQPQTPKATSRVFDVMAFGAKGDGATDDSTPVQAAVDAAVKARGGCVHFPSGTYRLTRPIVVASADRIDLTGEGRSATLLHDHAEHLLVWPEGFACREVSVRDLVFMAAREIPEDVAVIALLGGVERSFFGNLFLTARDGARMGSGIITRKVADTTTFDQCLMWGVGGVGLEVARGSEVRIFGGRITGHGAPVPHKKNCGILLTGNNGGVHIVTTDLIGMHTALQIGEATGASNREIFLTHSTIDSCTHGLVQRDNAYTSVAGCWAASCDEEQVLLDKEAVHAMLVIAGGTIFNGGAYGRGGANNGMVVRGGSFILSGVSIRHNKGTGLLVEAEQCQGYTVNGCRIHDNGTGAWLNGNAYSFQGNVMMRNGRQLVDRGGKGKIVRDNVMTDIPVPDDPYFEQRAPRN